MKKKGSIVDQVNYGFDHNDIFLENFKREKNSHVFGEIIKHLGKC